MEKTRIEKQKEYFFSIGPSEQEYREIFSRLCASGDLFTKKYETFSCKINLLNEKSKPFIFKDENVQKLFLEFWGNFSKLYNFLTHNLHDWKSERDGLAPHVSYIFRLQKQLLNSGDLKSIIEIKDADIPWFPENIKNFEGDWAYFFYKKFQPFVEIVIDSFDMFIKEIDEQTIFSEPNIKPTKHEHVHKFENSIQEKNIKVVSTTSGNSKETSNVFPHKIPDGTTWRQITISFIDDIHVNILVAGHSHNTGYADMGLIDSRSGKPNQQWDFFSILASKNGSLNISEGGDDIKSKWKKTKERLSTSLKEYFKIDSDPFERYTTKNGYKLKMTIFKKEQGIATEEQESTPYDDTTEYLNDLTGDN